MKEIAPAIITIVLVGILIAVGVTVLGNISETTRTTTQVTNQTIVLYTHNYTNVGTAAAVGHVITSSATGVNQTTGTAFGLTWDMTGNTGSSIKLTSQTALNGTYGITYQYGATNAWSEASTNASTGIDDFVTWFAIIIVIIVAAIIIFYVARSFRG